MAFDLKTAIGSFAPTLATMLGGPLAGTAVSALTSAFGLTSSGDQVKDVAAITAVVQNSTMTPEVIAAVRKADQDHEAIMGQQGIDLKKLNADHDLAMVQTFTVDTQDARKTFGQQKAIFWLGIAVLLTFAIVMTAVLWAAYQLLQGGITIKDVSVVAAISGMVGSVVGYVAANAQQVVGYFFGSSAGSSNKTDAMGDAVAKLVSATGNK
jgi:hypothetical protein